MIRSRFALAALIVACCAPVATAEEKVFHGGGWRAVAPAGADSPAGRIARARELLRSDELRKATGAGKAFLDEYENHPLAEEAYNIVAAAYMRRERLWKAYQWYEKQLERFPVGGLSERALAREAAIAEAFLAGKKRKLWGFIPLGMTEEGLEILDRVAERAPGSNLADAALWRAAEFLYHAERWEEATDAYDRYGEMFRGRRRSREAELQAARATYNRFWGVEYDDTPLLEAEQRFRTFLARYPDAEQRPQVASTLDAIENAKAIKDYRAARLYKRIGRDEAAAMYFREVVARYPATPWAEQSAEELEALPAPDGDGGDEGGSR